LTLEQATAGYRAIARRFADIDKEAKGYVTIEDVAVWRKMMKEARRQNRATEDDPALPRKVYQRDFPMPRPVNTIPIGVMTQATTPAEPADGVDQNKGRQASP
jgi:hypothetical protein